MCGIAGTIRFSGEPVNRSRLLAMRNVLTHRGPDDAGCVVMGRVGLAHTRLSIIDLDHGHQPMCNRDGRLWITYNGEIYNFRELRDQLKGAGYPFRTQSDTEVILAAYEAYGEHCVDHLRGMFAFAIWDAMKDRVFLARDRLGIKPLYYTITQNELAFGSEIKSLLAGGSVEAKFNARILPEYLASRYVAGRETFFEGVYKLLPGHTLSWTPATGIIESRYWRLPVSDEAADGGFREQAEMVRQGLEDAVRSHLVSDVPVGVFLSGGIDSSALAALMASMMDEPVRTYSIGFSEPGASELDYARLAAEDIGSIHRDITLSAESFFELLPRLIWHEDEPIAFTSSIPLHVVSRLAAQDVKVVLTGEGADELFLGYNRYRVTAWNDRLGRCYSGLVPERAREEIAALTPVLPAKLRRYAERTFLAREPGERSMFFDNFAVFGQGAQRVLLNDPGLITVNDPYSEGLKYYRKGGNALTGRMTYADMHTYLVELLMKQDQMSMSASIESRVPFLDHRLVEQIARIPGRHKLRVWQTKAVLREAVKDIVPLSILKRKKMGFPVPVGTWFTGEFRPLIEAFLLGSRARERGHFDTAAVKRLVEEHCRGLANHGERLWLLLNLEIWQRIFIDGQDPGTVYSSSQATASIAKIFEPQPLSSR